DRGLSQNGRPAPGRRPGPELGRPAGWPRRRTSSAGPWSPVVTGACLLKQALVAIPFQSGPALPAATFTPLGQTAPTAPVDPRRCPGRVAPPAPAHRRPLG